MKNYDLLVVVIKYIFATVKSTVVVFVVFLLLIFYLLYYEKDVLNEFYDALKYLFPVCAGRTFS